MGSDCRVLLRYLTIELRVSATTVYVDVMHVSFILVVNHNVTNVVYFLQDQPLSTENSDAPSIQDPRPCRLTEETRKLFSQPTLPITGGGVGRRV